MRAAHAPPENCQLVAGQNLQPGLEVGGMNLASARVQASSQHRRKGSNYRVRHFIWTVKLSQADFAAAFAKPRTPIGGA